MSRFITTVSGKKFCYTNLDFNSISIRDIAHSLSMIPRFAGHINRWWSVASHSILVSNLCDPKYALYGLLHDASEYVTMDIPSPLKHYLLDFQKFEHYIMSLVIDKYEVNLTNECEKNVKFADLYALLIESYNFCSPECYQDVSEYVYTIVPRNYLPFKLYSQSFKKAKQIYLNRFFELYNGQAEVKQVSTFISLWKKLAFRFSGFGRANVSEDGEKRLRLFTG